MYQAKKNGDQGENATIEKTEQAEQVKESEEKPAEIEKSDGTILDLSGEVIIRFIACNFTANT